MTNKQSARKTSNFFENLDDAQRAFVFGAPRAAVGLMRSVMEAVLRDHYRAEGANLSDRIRSARDRLPVGANEAALHRLRKLANAILHLDPDTIEHTSEMNEKRLEQEIVWLLFVLRSLIEGAEC